LTAKKRHRVYNRLISMGKRTEHLRLLSNMFPNCNKTYPDCPNHPVDENGNVNEMCTKCPIYTDRAK
jgi:hypothetical protein